MYMDFSKNSKDKRAVNARWEYQEIAEDEQLVGFYFKKPKNGAIKQLGLQTIRREWKQICSDELT